VPEIFVGAAADGHLNQSDRQAAGSGGGSHSAWDRGWCMVNSNIPGDALKIKIWFP
jgi:hypothetical protein